MDELRRLDDWSESSEEPLGQFRRNRGKRAKATPTKVRRRATTRDRGGSVALGVARPSANELLATVGALLLLAFFTFAFYWLIFLLSLQSDACSDHACNSTMFAFSIYAVPVGGIVLFVASVVLAVLVARRDRPIWLPAVLSCAILLLIFITAAMFNAWSAQDWGPLP